MKKLLISTALVSSVLTGVAFSQTTITGEMRIGYKTHYDGLDKGDSQRGFGTEQQINIQNKGKTNFGWDYASGFSIEGTMSPMPAIWKSQSTSLNIG